MRCAQVVRFNGVSNSVYLSVAGLFQWFEHDNALSLTVLAYSDFLTQSSTRERHEFFNQLFSVLAFRLLMSSDPLCANIHGVGGLLCCWVYVQVSAALR